ncbi:hypothetical protein QUA81_06225 [Microcoleus sp. F6_B4]
MYQIRLDRWGYGSAIEDDGDRRRSQSTLWAKILTARSTFEDFLANPKFSDCP